jgi:predicted Zn-dependent protease
LFALAAAAAANATVPTGGVFLLPLYNTKFKPVAQEFMDGVSGALTRTYVTRTIICNAEFYDGPCDANAVLDFLATREGRIMAITSAPLRAPVRSGISFTVTNVSGWADLPNEKRERPRGAVITTYGLWNVIQGDLAERLGVVAIHELGHNLGAWDCDDSGCYMNGKMHLSRGATPRAFCKQHRELLWTYLR